MRLQIAKPGEHSALVNWPFAESLDEWAIPGLHDVVGLHRHVVRLVETGDTTYIVKELPDHLAQREWRLLRELGDAGMPTAEVVGVVIEREADMDGLLITRNIDYSLPYRVLLSGVVSWERTFATRLLTRTVASNANRGNRKTHR